MIVAITGGTGFIGRKLVLRHLAQGDEVRVLSRRPAGEAGLPDAVDIHRGDLAGAMGNLQSFVAGVDVLYHCAGEILDSSRMHAIHVAGTRKLVDAAAGQVGHWVQLSSVGAYGPISQGVITETTSENPLGVYEATKAESDRLVSAAAARSTRTASSGKTGCWPAGTRSLPLSDFPSARRRQCCRDQDSD